MVMEGEVGAIWIRVALVAKAETRAWSAGDVGVGGVMER